MDKNKRSLRNGKLKANRASQTEEQKKEKLRIGREKERTKRITKLLQEEKKWSSEQKTTRNSTWPLSNN